MSFVYTAIPELCLTGGLVWRRSALGMLKLALIDGAAYVEDPAHTSLAQVPAGAIIGTAFAITGVTAEGANAASNDVVFVGIKTGPPATALLLYADYGSRDASRVIAYYDDAVGLPITPDGSDIRVAFPDHHLWRL